MGEGDSTVWPFERGFMSRKAKVLAESYSLNWMFVRWCCEMVWLGVWY